MSNVRWQCPIEGEGSHGGVNAPSRLRRIDIRRYCLPCSQTKGVLVERVQPAKQTKEQKAKQAKQEAREASKKAKAETKAADVVEPLTRDEATLTLGRRAQWSMWCAMPFNRGYWRGVVLRVPVTMLTLSPGKGTSMTFRREDNGEEIAATFRPSERVAWVSTRPLRDFDGTSLGPVGFDVFVSLADEAPARCLPRAQKENPVDDGAFQTESA